MWARGEHTSFHVLQLGLQKGASIGGVPKKLGDGPINLAPYQKKIL